jgi:dGTPase
LLIRLEAKTVDENGNSVGLNLTRASLDAATKYPWPRAVNTRKFGVYDDDLEIFHWIRRGAPEGRQSMEAQIMDWSDDVAYSVHDLEDAIVFRTGKARRATAGSVATLCDGKEWLSSGYH